MYWNSDRKYYQKIVYSTASRVNIPTAPILNALPVWNSLRLILMPFGSSWEDSSKLMIMIIMARIRKTTTHRFIKGRPGINILNTKESGIETMAAHRTELGVVRFQNSPKINIENMAGVVKPVYS